MTPGRLQAVLREAVALHRAGRLEQAEKLYEQARAFAPKSFDLLHNSGLLAYQQGKLDQALDLLTRALRIEPKAVVCQMRLALVLLAAGRAAEAEKRLRSVVAVQPDYHQAWDNLATCLKTQGKVDEAISCHQKSVTLNPQHPNAWFNYGLTLSLKGQITEALRCHERALEADPTYARGHFGRAQALQQGHRPVEAVEAYGRFLALDPNHNEARSFRLFCLHYLDDISREQMFAEHVAYGRALESGRARPLPNTRDPLRKLRVAIISPDLRKHSCAYFLEPLLAHLPRESFELFLYHDHISEDSVSERLRRHAAVWRNFVGQPARPVEEAIRADAPDVLIDLAGHTGMTTRLPLFQRRLAPVQMTYLGYPDTTGVPAMDYRFTDAIADPVGEADRFATEQLVRFADCAWAYQPPVDAPDVRVETRSLSEPVVFGCFNNLAKITDRQLALWSRVLAATPNSRLLLKGKGLSEHAVSERYEERLRRAGIDPARVELAERTPDAQSHLAMYHRVDVALDPFPYHGTTTTCEALWMGIPVVTLIGSSHMSRVSASLLTAIGRPEWIAATPEDYVDIATALAASSRGRMERNELREAMQRSPLLDHAGQASRFASALRDCWRQWCHREKSAVAA
jgi:predicted O-linked N-acetylglucosamine transferase (SPINDLY family)